MLAVDALETHSNRFRGQTEFIPLPETPLFTTRERWRAPRGENAVYGNVADASTHLLRRGLDGGWKWRTPAG
jgi:hypothetical protein